MTQERAFSGSIAIGVYEWCAHNFTEHLGSPNYFTALHSSSSRVHCIALHVEISYFVQNELQFKCQVSSTARTLRILAKPFKGML